MHFQGVVKDSYKKFDFEMIMYILNKTKKNKYDRYS